MSSDLLKKIVIYKLFIPKSYISIYMYKQDFVLKIYNKTQPTN